MASQICETVLRSGIPTYWPLASRFRQPFNMSQPHHNIFVNEEDHDSLSFYDHNQWVFVEAKSSLRPPVYNPANLSCADMAGYSEGLSEIPQPAIPPQGCQFENHGNTYYQPPAQSDASSTTSISGPEGVEREDPNLAIAASDAFLPLGPEAGLNEASHRRSASFHSDMPLQLKRYLVDRQKNEPQPISPTPAQDRFLSQNLHIQSSKKNNKDKMRSKLSYQSFESYPSEDEAFPGFGLDATAYTGIWIDEERLLYGFSSTLSGTTDEPAGE